MRCRNCFFLLFIMVMITTNCSAQNAEAEVLKVVNDFFDTMEKKDSEAFNSLFLENAYAYSIRKKGDSNITRSSILKASSTVNILKERLREEDITIHVNGNVAAVWAPYDFWINDKHSHCGHEVFTFLKNRGNWRIASLTYSVEKDSCLE